LQFEPIDRLFEDFRGFTRSLQ